MFKLIGILIVILGFVLKIDSIAVVITSAIATGMAGGLSFVDTLSVLGRAFVETRYVSLSILTLPVIALLERNGLRETATRVISQVAKATAGRILSLFVVLRTVAAAFSIRISGHVQFIRPVIYPMVKAAAERHRPLREAMQDKLKALSNAMENYGNFFGQNIFVAAPGVLLIVSTMQEMSITVTPYDVAMASIPMGIIATALACVQNYAFDRQLQKLGEYN